MRLYFISDNRYFLSGIQACHVFQERDISIICGCDVEPIASPCLEDVVIIYLRDLEMRHRVLRMRTIASCRVIILTRMAPQPVSVRGTGYVCFSGFPWILPYNLSIDVLVSFIDSAVSIPFLRRSTNINELLVINYLAEGRSTTCLNETLGLSEKYIYSVKRKAIMRYGLRGNSALVTLACRDIAVLNML